VKEGVKKIYSKILSSEEFIEKHPLEEEKYDVTSMKLLNKFILKKIGFNFKHARIDVSAHPFTQNIGLKDVRITTWYHGKDFRRSFFAAIHEFGHAIYELQISEELAKTPIGTGVSMGIHESQSRFWENVVGRSEAFLEYFYEDLKAFLSFLEEYSKKEVLKYFNLVRPEYLRVEADEVQYPLHVILRYEIEKALIAEELSVSEIPTVWNEKMKNYIGITPPTDSLGCLQDIHWSLASIGYFTDYAIGRILKAQIKHKL